MTELSSSSGSYEYIVVGAGSAGCVLANRLTEDPHIRVLLLEAGADDAHPYVRVPLGLGMLHRKRMFDWQYNTVPEAGMANRELMTLRGKVLGGSSSTNFMAFTRGAPGDYDRWARNGATGWSFADMLPYFKKIETWEDGETPLRGGSGPVDVVWTRTSDPLVDAFLAAAKGLGYPLTEDFNSVAEGFGKTQFSISGGRRHSTARAYLRPVMHRKNLTVHTHALAHRIIIDHKRAVGIEYEREGVLRRAETTREVLLAGGSFNSPQLLMLSGIGPADHLRAHGIDVIADLPVGDNLQDHLKGVLLWKRRSPRGPFHKLMRYDRIALAMLDAYVFGRGPATIIPLILQGYIRTQPESEVPDIEFMLRGAPMNAGPWFPFVSEPYVDAFGLDPILLHPRSRGTVRLRSAFAGHAVRIHYNYLSNPADVDQLRRGFRLARDIGEAPEIGAFREHELLPGRDVQSDADIDAHLRATTTTVSHPIGTCKMGKDATSVVDPELRVRGVSGLRIVDASVFPDLISAHTNAAVMAIAERASELIRGTVGERASRESAAAAAAAAAAV